MKGVREISQFFAMSLKTSRSASFFRDEADVGCIRLLSLIQRAAHDRTPVRTCEKLYLCTENSQITEFEAE
jgi:hypothetical protein